MTDLPPVHLTVVQPPGYVHSLGLVDQARYVRHQLTRFGSVVTLAKNRLRADAVNIVFGAHLGFPAPLRERQACVFFNLEQLGSGGAQVDKDYLSLLRSSAAVDYDVRNVAAYADDPKDVPIVPFLYAPYLEPARSLTLEDRPIDLLFFGSLNDRRRRFIERIEALGIKVSTLDRPIYGPERDAYIRQAKAVLNCSYYDSSRFEQVRVSHCLSLGTPVISECADPTALPAAFQGSVFLLQPTAVAPFFSNHFGRPAFFDQARAMLQTFRGFDPVESYADLMAFMAGFGRGFEARRDRAPWRPTRIQLGCGDGYRLGWLNLDADPAHEPDLLADASMPLELPALVNTSGGEAVAVAESCAEQIDAGDLPARVDNLEGLMSNALRLLGDSGLLGIRLPVPGRSGSASDPRHRRELSEQSFDLFTEGAWRLGWLHHCFEVAQVAWHDAQGQVCEKSAATGMQMVLRKRHTTPHERSLARTVLVDFGGAQEARWESELDAVMPPFGLELAQSRSIRAPEPATLPATLPAPLALAMDADADRVDALLDLDHCEDAIRHIAHAVHASFMQPGVAHHSLYYPRFDAQLVRLAALLAKQADGCAPLRTRENHVILATELYAIGGHSKVVEEVARELLNPVLILTDLFDTIATQPQTLAWLEAAYPMAHVVVLPSGSPWAKARELHQMIRRLKPDSIWYFNHHQDPVPFAATLALADVRKVLVHHCDHNPSLGSTLASIEHVDITDKLQETCSAQRGKPTEMLRLYVADQGGRPPLAVAGLAFSVLTAGRAGKFSRLGDVSLQRIVACTLATISGTHFHIGPLPEDWLADIRASLVSQGLDAARFVHLGAVDSLWATIKQIDAAVYIGSAPVSGGRGAIEAQGCGLPVLPFTGFETGSLLADYSSYADPDMGWATIGELAAMLATVGDRHAVLGRRARKFYEQHFSRAGFAATVRHLAKRQLSTGPCVSAGVTECIDHV